MSTIPLTYCHLEVETNFNRSVLRVFQKSAVFLGPPRNGIVTESFRLSQAKRISVLTAIEKSNHWRWIQEWFKRQNGAGDVCLWQQQKETQTSLKSFPLKQIFPNHMTKDEFFTDPGTCRWVIGSIHSHLPVYMAGVSSLLTSQGFFICSRKVTRSSLETTRPAIRKSTICFARDSSGSNLICIQVRREGTRAKSLQSCLTLCHPMDHNPPGCSVHGILQARILEWVAMPSSRRSSRSRDWTRVSYVSCIGRQVLYH